MGASNLSYAVGYLKMQLRPLILLFACCCAFFHVPAAFGQAHSDSGDITGTVVDANGGAIAAAKITVTDTVRGVARSFEADAQGEYRATALPPGNYRVRVEANGFAVKNVEGVQIRVGESMVLRTDLEVGALNTEVSVTADAPVIETTRTQQASTVDLQRIQSLPINRRNYLDLALTTPGVVETNDLVDGTDFRVVQTPQSGLSFGGGNGRGNGFFIDGAENYVNSGGVRPSVSQEAVREFQVNRNSFTSEFGNASGGVINIITKSGGNELHGDVFGFLRNTSFQARNYFDPVKSSFTRAQYGATLGGAIRKDKTFYFAAFEGLDRHETAFVPILQDRTPFYSLTKSQTNFVNFFLGLDDPQFVSIGRQLQTALVPANNPDTLRLFEQNSGEFPFSETNYQGSIRLDHQFNEKDFFFFRGNVTSGVNQNAALGALIGYNRARSVDVLDGTTMFSNTYVFSPKWVGETRAMFGYVGLKVIPNDPNGPQVDIEGFGAFGREIFLPSRTFERHYQFLQNFNYTSGKHAVKFGFDIDPVRDTVVSETFFGGRFQFGPGVALGQLINAQAGDPTAADNLGALLNAIGQGGVAAALNESITSLQAYSLGIPLFYQQGFGDPNWIGTTGRYNMFVQDAWHPTPKLNVNIGLRYEIEINPSPVRDQTKNVGPRFGFAYTPFSDGKTVIRGGYGLFYSRTDAQAANLPATLNGVQIAQTFVTALGEPSVINPLTNAPVTSRDIWTTLGAQGVLGQRTISQADIAQFGLYPGPNAPARVIFGIDNRNFRDPYAHQASLQVERAFGDVSISAGYELNRGLHGIRTLDQNLFYTGRAANGQPTYGFYNPDILQYNVVQSTANSSYNALIVQVTKRYARHLSVNAHYTFSKSIDESTDFNSDFEPNDQLNAKAERGLSSFNQKHRLVGTAVFDSALPGGVGTNWRQNLFGNWVIAPIIQANSGRPFNILTGFDSVGDNHDTTHRPYGFGRNVGHGPDYVTADLRISRKFPLSHDGQRNVEILAEGFNLLNRTNFKSLNNKAGTADPAEVPRPLAGHKGSPLEPFAFTSAYDPRQFQFGLRVNF